MDREKATKKLVRMVQVIAGGALPAPVPMANMNRQIVLAARPEGMDTVADRVKDRFRTGSLRRGSSLNAAKNQD